MNLGDLEKLFNYLGSYWGLYSEEDKKAILFYWQCLFRATGDLYLKSFASSLARGLLYTPRRINYKWRKYQFIYELDFKEDPNFLDKGRASADMVSIATKTQIGGKLVWRKLGGD